MPSTLKAPLLTLDEENDEKYRQKTTPPQNDDTHNEIKVYRIRWLVLILFICSGVANAFVLLTFSPIAGTASDYFGGIGSTAINLLAVSFQIMYLPGTIMAVNLLSRYDLRRTMIVAGLLTACGCVIRYIGTVSQLDGTAAYCVVLIGTIIVRA